MTAPHPLEPHIFVIFGATGDLTSRKLMPALYHLVEDSSADVYVLGVATSALDDADFRALTREALDDAGLDGTDAWRDDRVHFQTVGRDEGYSALRERIEAIEQAHGLPGNRVFYLALPPPVFPIAITRLGEAGLASSQGWTRLVVEKPFGRDLKSARALNQLAHTHFSEDQIYRIDHYLGKETVQNLLVFRFANPIFEGSWNRDRIERVEITVAESLDIGSRGGYYERSGAVRDMVQSHLTQVFTLVAMESPTSIRADSVRAEKVKVLQSIAPLGVDDVVFGQYTRGTIDGAEIPAYRALEGVDPASTTPTYAAVRLFVNNWRWQGVPFVLRTAKALPRRTTQVVVTFRPPPVCLFHGVGDDCFDQSDVLTLTMQPDEGFSLQIEVKEPGESGGIRRVPLHFEYGDEFGEIAEAYETLLRDVAEGDQTHFVRSDWVEESWRVYAPILDGDLPVYPYPAGTWGPDEATNLLGHPAKNWGTK
ncbi:glucose-6-phosphate dehydrogenase [bacterium]|nr:glucose-6-phosphate dehydrogenase [bacterium]